MEKQIDIAEKQYQVLDKVYELTYKDKKLTDKDLKYINKLNFNMFKDHKNADVLFFSMKFDYLKKFHDKLEKIKMQNLQGKTWTKGSRRMVMLLTYLMNY